MLESFRLIVQDASHKALIETVSVARIQYAADIAGDPVPSADPGPCVFCGAIGEPTSCSGFAGDDDSDHHFVECSECRATGPWCKTRAAGIEAWNKFNDCGI